MSNIMPAFDRFPNEGAAIGRLLAGYGELELELCFCVAAVTNDFDKTFKDMFGQRGERRRLEIADQLGRDLYRKLGLETIFAEAIGAVDYCREIRNQYAHCHWSDHHGRQLAFVTLEGAAKSQGRVDYVWNIPTSDIDLVTLHAQEAYYVYARDCLKHATDQYKVKAGLLRKSPFSAPAPLARPPLCKP